MWLTKESVRRGREGRWWEAGMQRREDATSESGKCRCGWKAYNNKVRGQSEVERSTLTREKATHQEIKDGRGCQRWLALGNNWSEEAALTKWRGSSTRTRVEEKDPDSLKTTRRRQTEHLERRANGLNKKDLMSKHSGGQGIACGIWMQDRRACLIKLLSWWDRGIMWEGPSLKMLGSILKGQISCALGE